MTDQTLTCPACGAESPSDAAFCPNCGKGFSGKYLLAADEARRMAERGVVAAGTEALPDVVSTSSTKRCPFCAEEIQAAAVVCRFCQRDVAGAPASTSTGRAAKSSDERRTILSKQIERQAAPDMRVESRSDYQAVLVYGKPTNHLLHFLIGLFTIGVWWIVWLFIAANNRVTRKMITVDEFGVARAKDY